MPIPRNAHYVPGSNRHSVRLGDDTIVSRANAESLFARNRGYRSNYERKQAFKKMPSSDKNWQAARREGTSRADFKETEDKLRADYARTNFNYRDLDKSPNGPLAKYLESIGRRSSGAPWAVGESPGVK